MIPENMECDAMISEVRIDGAAILPRALMCLAKDFSIHLEIYDLMDSNHTPLAGIYSTGTRNSRIFNALFPSLYC